MFVVRLLLFSVLSYNTKALPAKNVGYGWNGWNPFATVPVTSKGTNGSESFAVDDNYSYPVPPGVVDELSNKPTGDKPTIAPETNDAYSVTTEREYLTTTPDSWYNRRTNDSETTTAARPYWYRGLREYTRNTTTSDFLYNRTVEDSETTTAARPYNWYWNRVGSITLENGILTAHLPETRSEEEKTITETATTPKTPIDWWSNGATATTRRPYYYQYWPYRPRIPIDPVSTTTPDSWYDKTAEDSTTTTTARPYNGYWGWRDEVSKTIKITTDSLYNKTAEVSGTTTTPTPYNGYWDWRDEYSKNVTTPTTDSWHEYYTWYTTSTDKYHTRYPRTTTAPTRATSTTDYYEYTWYPTRTYNYTWYPTSTTDTYKYNTDKTTDNTDQANRTMPIGRCKSCNPENISINSTISTNDGQNYGILINLLKEIARKILSSYNSAATNPKVILATASGHGNIITINNKV